jgi:hypothetical protein
MKCKSEWNNKPVLKIGLNNWAKEHRLKKGDIFTYKGVSHMVTGKSYDWRKDLERLNLTQLNHVKGNINIYEPVEAYKIKWFHKGDVYYPLTDSLVKENLPPVYIQWKDAYRKSKHVRSRRFTTANI